MGISINVGAKQDYSYLFNSLPGSKAGSNLNFLADYASIKNGSYGKLMKAYYAKNENDSVSSDSSKKTVSTSKDSGKTLSKIENAADDLKESADKLITKGSKSVFNKKDVTSTDEDGLSTTTKEYDTEAIYSAVSSFVKTYNSLIDAAGDSKTNSIINKTSSLIKMTEANEKLLSQAGITIEKDNTLSIDEEAFKKSNMSAVKSLFNGNSSYAYQVSAQASLIDFAAGTQASKSNTYTASGGYGNPYSTGNMIDSIF